MSNFFIHTQGLTNDARHCFFKENRLRPTICEQALITLTGTVFYKRKHTSAKSHVSEKRSL